MIPQLILLLLLLTGNSFSQELPRESQEIPKIILSLNDLRDLPFEGFRNFEVTTSSVIDVQSLPGGILRIKAIGTGSTFLYVWTSNGRTTTQFEVTGMAPNIVTDFRPGYNPQGTEFIYHTSMTNQYASGQWIAPFWNHDFSSAVPFHDGSQWRTLLHATTNANALNGSPKYPPFSSATAVDQLLSYYQTDNYTVALGDVNYNTGELSLIGFPLRGASAELYGNQNRDRIQLFGGLNRPQFRSNTVFNDPASGIVGLSGAKDIFPNVSLRSSFIYLSQPETNISFVGRDFQNDYVADIGFQARPLTEELTVEGEYGKSADDSAYRGLVEYRPFWGRLMVSYKQLGQNYINPATFYLLKNYRETNFISEYQATKKLGFNLNYQFSQFGSDPLTAAPQSDVHSINSNTLYQASDTTSYLTGVTITKGFSSTNPQEYARVNFTYQRLFKENNDQMYVQLFGQHYDFGFAAQQTTKAGGGFDTRYTKNFSPTLQLYLQTAFQMNQVQTTFITTGSPDFLESILTWGPTFNWLLRDKTISAGIYENMTVQGAFDDTFNVLQPFASIYYSPNQALSLGSRINYNFDIGNDYSYLMVLGEFVYRFGSKIPDTLLSTLIPSAQISGVVFVDSNSDGVYQKSELLIKNFTSQINDSPPEISRDGTFMYEPDSGRNMVTVTLPPEYKNYQFSIDNPLSLDLYSRESRALYFGVSQRIALNGRAISYREEITNTPIGFDGAKVTITGENFNTSVYTSASGIFNLFVPHTGTYHVKLEDTELPPGYKSIGSTEFDVKVNEGVTNKIPSFVIEGKRFIIGIAFFDENLNGTFDEGEKPVPNVKVSIGKNIVITESDGSFAISKISPGTYYVNTQPDVVNGYRQTFMDNKIIVPEAGTVEVSVPYVK